jgi:hypothetical protein
LGDKDNPPNHPQQLLAEKENIEKMALGFGQSLIYWVIRKISRTPE